MYILHPIGKFGDFSFRFRVKLYPVSPTYIFDEVTRYWVGVIKCMHHRSNNCGWFTISCNFNAI